MTLHAIEGQLSGSMVRAVHTALVRFIENPIIKSTDCVNADMVSPKKDC